MEYGLIGEKLKHSYSKEIHEMLGKYEYEICEVPKENLARFIMNKEFKGLNVTIPYKEAVIPYLDYIDPIAKRVGAVNTIVNEDGILKGYNTDVLGFRSMLVNANVSVLGKGIFILGTGGTSKTAYDVCKSLGADNIYFVTRGDSRGGRLITYEEAVTTHRMYCDILINTTPCGMFPNSEDMAIDPGALPNLKCTIDVIYNPLRTKLMSKSKKIGINTVGGLYMLVSQAIASAEIFTGEKFKVGTNKRVYNNVYFKISNVVLTGMPGAGKTSIGKILAEKLDKEFYDVDAEIEKITGITPSQYITQKGEKEFRKIEATTIAELSKKTNAVIATGGGSVIYAENIDRLKRNGRIYFIDRSLNKLVPTGDRPLSNTIEQLKMRYNERIEKYRTSADAIIPGDGSVIETANRIVSMIDLRS